MHTTTTMQTSDICPRLFSDCRNWAGDWSMIPWCTRYFVYTKYNPEYKHVFTYVCGCVKCQNWRHHHWKTKTTKYIQLTSPKLWALHFFAVLFAQIGTYTVLLQPGSQSKPEMTCSYMFTSDLDGVFEDPMRPMPLLSPVQCDSHPGSWTLPMVISSFCWPLGSTIVWESWPIRIEQTGSAGCFSQL